MSHPTWVRGLKFAIKGRLAEQILSHPTWVRGLKFCVLCQRLECRGRTPRGCVD